MNELLLTLFLYWLAAYFAVQIILPLMIEAVSFLALVLLEAVKAAGRGILILLPYIGAGVKHLLRLIWKSIYWLCYFLAVYVAELLFPTQDEDESDEGECDADTAQYKRALQVLGLQTGFSSADLKRSYIAAMKVAHPDRGGSEDRAREINAARDYLMAMEDGLVTSP